VKRRILLGTFCLSAGYYDAFYGKAQQARRLMTREFQETFAKVDVLVCPTSPCTAFKFGEKSSDPLAMYLSDIATIPANIAGVPAISVPCGVDANGLPIGLQITGPHLSEAQLFRVARAFEEAQGPFV
jgi:aspartyl-tRNA(Asn)/glutamyl-tRNA(Gln) amidotransferase subunit A